MDAVAHELCVRGAGAWHADETGKNACGSDGEVLGSVVNDTTTDDAGVVVVEVKRGPGVAGSGPGVKAVAVLCISERVGMGLKVATYLVVAEP